MNFIHFLQCINFLTHSKSDKIAAIDRYDKKKAVTFKFGLTS